MEHPIGIIGGMGPMASQLFYKMVTEHTAAERDQDHIDLILLSDASMPDRTAAILSGQYEGPYEQLLSDARLLEQCGCTAIAITCNTAHFFADMIADKIGIPILHMIRETAAALAGRCPGGVVGVMATDGTVQTGLYQKALTERGLTPWTPPAEIQKEVMHQIYDRVKKGLPCDQESWTRIEAAYRRAGCAAVVLACTELSVIKADEGLGDWYVDPMETLARKVIETAGKTYR
ncbi:amino acid racemase [Intestinimonas aquisgranensis]|nr:amino acid racemase [Intestinimonas aquisgranensis]